MNEQEKPKSALEMLQEMSSTAQDLGAKSQSIIEKIEHLAEDLQSVEKLGVITESMTREVSKLHAAVMAVRDHPIKPDLGDFDQKLDEGIARINSQLNIPRYVVYLFTGSLAMLLLSGFFLWYGLKSKRETIDDFLKEKEKTHAFISNEENEEFNSIIRWFEGYPKYKKAYQSYKAEKQSKK